MNRSLLQFVLRHPDPDGSDADLLGRFVTSGDEAAFATLVKRHGPMVWAVCRQSVPNRTDAEDVFQAVFLALAKSAKAVRRPEHLAGWLHGAAVRIAAKAKRGYARRTAHEHRTAKPEADAPVSAAAWNEMLAAVHDEVAKLPRSLRAAFVLCDLEGADPAEAATRLGLKANTLSGQLTRARRRLLDALTKRGIGGGLAAVGTAVFVPQTLADQVTTGVAPNAAVVELAAEITAMKVSQLKLLAAGLMVTCGLTFTGVGMLPRAEAQKAPPAGGTPGGPGLTPPKALPGTGSPDGGEGVSGSEGGMAGPGGMAGMGGMMGGGPVGMGGMMGGAPAPRAAFEYLFVAKPGTLPQVAALLRTKATQNWEYTGPLDVDPSDPKGLQGVEGVTKDTRVVLVFKRHAPNGMPGMGGGGGMMSGGMGMGRPGMTPGGMSGGPGMGGPGGMLPGMSGPGAGPSMPGGPGGGPGAVGAPGGAGGRTAPGGGETGAPGGFNPLGMMGGAGPAPGKSPEVYEVFRLKNGTAEEAAKTINEVFNGPDGKTERVKATADKSSNSVIVTKASAADLWTIQKLLEKTLDAKGGGVGGESKDVTAVYKLKHMAPTAELVGQIRTHYADALGQKTSAGLAISGDAKNNSIVASGSQRTVDLVRQIIDVLDVKPVEIPKAYSVMFKITEVAPSEAAKALKSTMPDSMKGVEVVAADSLAYLLINAPSADQLEAMVKTVRKVYPKATEVKPTAGR
jgi:RNA polymerase sigma factor (sigma-70 family)